MHEARQQEPGSNHPDHGSRAAADLLAHAAEVIRTEAEAITRLTDRLGSDFVQAVHLILGCKGMVVVTGMGKAGLVGAKLSATMASTGTPSLTLHPGEALHGDLGRIRADDVVVALSNSGETAEIKALIPAARRIGANLVAITESRESTLGQRSDCVLELGPVGEACPLGLAPTASTSAMMAIGDALAMVVAKARGFSREDYARFHPAGALGRKLLRVAEVMRSGDQLPLIKESATLSEALELASQVPGRHPGATLVVGDEGQMVGIFTDGDLRRLLLAAGGPPGAEPIAAHMGRNPKSVHPDQLVEEAMHLIHEYKVDQLPVLDDDRRPVGLLDVQDVLDLRL
ncbi:KpsF/GutQ family sugar-phosphate isomerase [Engelhardtia mirabilis]|uniref:Arabinose 5-phosphate isomerase KdsD n=1 Tax=Engelhardtia mirabilis TaxID=2528011 RepID=A0A518BD97_9BACT|nr:Arabinose 5-phosphate isomerase KdsD [Planctomycetes bacterium Pla133]QDU99275.1 Arabinose 5-phosphate isomerase KdsD [Planctomycetes bacterium Pla86]